jgi:hypothetical protein
MRIRFTGQLRALTLENVHLLREPHDETRWSEHARTRTVEQAHDLMQGLARLHSTKDWWVGWIVMESICLGSLVQEKPIHWYPSKEHILERLRQAGLLKTSLSPLHQTREST